ncbi:MAG: redox-sensitive transcriptional activator SoxR [Thermoleophilia bacterium]
MDRDDLLSIGEVARRAGIATSALRFYDQEGLIPAERRPGGNRRYRRSVLRRIAFVRAGQRVGLSLDQIRDALEALPDDGTPTAEDWERSALLWRQHLDARITELQALRERLTSCIGCGCLSMESCALFNPDDLAGRAGPGPRFLIPQR